MGKMKTSDTIFSHSVKMYVFVDIINLLSWLLGYVVTLLDPSYGTVCLHTFINLTLASVTLDNLLLTFSFRREATAPAVTNTFGGFQHKASLVAQFLIPRIVNFLRESRDLSGSFHCFK